MRKRYSPKLKFQVVLEVLRSEKTVAQIAKAYGVHPNSINAWKREFIENGPDIFDQNGLVSGYEKRLSELEQLLGKKEVEIALLKNFLGQRG
jgi:transposase-like protein